MADQAKSSAQKAKLSQAALTAAAGALIPHSGALPMEGRAAAQEVDLEDLFSLRRPKNAWSGASSGLQSIAKGARACSCCGSRPPSPPTWQASSAAQPPSLQRPPSARSRRAPSASSRDSEQVLPRRATPTSRSPHPRGPGLASAVILPVAGAAIGVVQLGRCAQPLLACPSLGAHLPSAAA